LENLFVEFASEIDVKKKPGQKLSLQKYLRQLHNDASKLLKLRNLSSNQDGKPKSDRSNSGFMKPVRISQELASFIGVSVEEPITRVEITKKICQYIKEKNLQNPLDRRIIEADSALENIVGTTGDEDEKLTYYSLQKRIQNHIFKN
jgi:upstream activation factor subunit UAF30